MYLRRECHVLTSSPSLYMLNSFPFLVTRRSKVAWLLAATPMFGVNTPLHCCPNLQVPWTQANSGVWQPPSATSFQLFEQFPVVPLASIVNASLWYILHTAETRPSDATRALPALPLKLTGLTSLV